VKRIGVILVEDDLPVRQLIKSYLLSFPQVEVLAESASGEEALALVELLKPAVIFLDIELPNLNGLSIAQLLKDKQPNIGIIFITGHPAYAVEAFQLEAVDYLVKPVSKEALGRTLGKIERFIGLQNSKSNDQTFVNRMALKFNREIHIINPADIYFIEKNGRHSLFHTSQGIFPSSDTLRGLADKLDSNFYRCHRSFIININQIEHITPIADRIYEISFSNYPHRITMGRDKYEGLCHIILKQK